MRVGTKSLLFGVHQFAWHPYTVLRAWHRLYGWPNWRELVCILIHDWGYWGSPDMDGPEGEQHCAWAAGWASRHFGERYRTLCLYHSRHMARRWGAEPSRLCWPDKLSHAYDPAWFYLLRARASGELAEYREEAAAGGFVPLSTSDREWFRWMEERFRRMGEAQSTQGVPFEREVRP